MTVPILLCLFIFMGIVAIVLGSWLYLELNDPRRVFVKSDFSKFYDDIAKFLDNRLDACAANIAILQIIANSTFVKDLSIDKALALTRVLDELNRLERVEQHNVSEALRLVSYHHPSVTHNTTPLACGKFIGMTYDKKQDKFLCVIDGITYESSDRVHWNEVPSFDKKA